MANVSSDEGSSSGDDSERVVLPSVCNGVAVGRLGIRWPDDRFLPSQNLKHTIQSVLNLGGLGEWYGSGDAHHNFPSVDRSSRRDAQAGPSRLIYDSITQWQIHLQGFPGGDRHQDGRTCCTGRRAPPYVPRSCPKPSSASPRVKDNSLTFWFHTNPSTVERKRTHPH